MKFKKAIIAAGSQAVKLPFMPEDPRIVDSTGALELRQIPKRMLVIGGGIIGLEMATVYSTLGARIDVVEMLDGLMQGRRPRSRQGLGEVQREALRQRHAQDQDDRRPKRRTTASTSAFEGEKAPGRSAALRHRAGRGRAQPERQKIGADKAGVAVTDRGFINVDKQMRTNVPHIFAIGDLVGQPMLAHKAVHEAHVAAEAAHGEKSYLRRARRFRRWPTPIRKSRGPA